MSGFLLDTHTYIWASHKVSNLSKIAAAVIGNGSHVFFISAVSAWEIARKARLGKLSREIAQEFEHFVHQAGYIELPVSMRHAALAGDFPAEHKDPFDRILAAQALYENLTLLSSDSKLDAFGIHRIW